MHCLCIWRRVSRSTFVDRPTSVGVFSSTSGSSLPPPTSTVHGTDKVSPARSSLRAPLVYPDRSADMGRRVQHDEFRSTERIRISGRSGLCRDGTVHFFGFRRSAPSGTDRWCENHLQRGYSSEAAYSAAATHQRTAAAESRIAKRISTSSAVLREEQSYRRTVSGNNLRSGGET